MKSPRRLLQDCFVSPTTHIFHAKDTDLQAEVIWCVGGRRLPYLSMAVGVTAWAELTPFYLIMTCD